MGFYTFIQGGFRGKVGDHIGQKQNGKYIQKAYVVPKNPQSPAQTAQRNKFKSANDFARISLYWFERNALESYQKSDFLNERVKKYFEVRDRLEDTLEPLQMPRYESSSPSTFTVEAEYTGESKVHFLVDYSKNSGIPDTPPPSFNMKARVLFYNFETSTFYPYESGIFEEDTFSDTREAWLEEDIDVGEAEEYINIPFYLFLEMDGKYSDSYYAFTW